jgi:hypothetical protein
MALAHAISQQPPWWRPHNEAHWARIRQVTLLAPHLCVALDSDSQRDIAAVTAALWAELKGAAFCYRLPPQDLDLDPREARRQLAIYDQAWLLMQALDVLSRIPSPRRQESSVTTDRRLHWAQQVTALHRELKAMTARKTP